jgi:hypothetical protein
MARECRRTQRHPARWSSEPLPKGWTLKAMPVIGFLTGGAPDPATPGPTAFRQGLSEAGYVVGQNVAIEYRGVEGRFDRMPALIADLVGRKVDGIAITAGFLTVQLAKDATSTIPIVFFTGDPVAAGLAASLARPGGNLTGISTPFARVAACTSLIMRSALGLFEYTSKPITLAWGASSDSNSNRLGSSSTFMSLTPTPPSQLSCNGKPAHSSSAPSCKPNTRRSRSSAASCGRSGRRATTGT